RLGAGSDQGGDQAAGGAASAADPQEPEVVSIAEHLDAAAFIVRSAAGAGDGRHELFDLLFTRSHSPPPPGKVRVSGLPLGLSTPAALAEVLDVQRLDEVLENGELLF